MSRNKSLAWVLGGLLALTAVVPSNAQEFIFRMDLLEDGSGAAAGPIALVAGSGANFTLNAGGVAPGTMVPGSIETLTFRNTSSVDVEITGASVSNTENFAITAQTCVGTLAAGTTCTVSIQFSADDNGTYNGNLILTAA
ncbi:hypothetical protein LAZ40_11795 [Cereibacter sphaeroides]|uniref:hypothetical protein n=1 Tax=Cereibacter sphaeroides TaxID=1063 RepID=UPI001F2E208B|nr:hypothetical protein [Cereibacter sphaeroides]MCE6959702.1 hypothetical protein [Cereibacter sphaeroides]MCE6974437.1 hypothetical protein [Cereibacter sphaeroides]